LANKKQRNQTIKRYFHERDKYATYDVGKRVLLWDFSHSNRGKHTEFQKLWLEPYVISTVVNNSSYLLKDDHNILFSL
jgi:hypothetical protein